MHAPDKPRPHRKLTLRTKHQWTCIQQFRSTLDTSSKARYTCSIYNDSQKRLQDDACGAYFQPIGRDTYPVGFAQCRWEIFRATDAKWRAGFLDSCGFYLEDADVAQLVAQHGYDLVEDETSGELFLFDARHNQFPIVESWHGSCLRCGTCCRFPRIATGTRCKYLIAE